MSTNNKIVIKPHHFLDIMKFYGRGLEEFIPDLICGHDFYKVGNKILNNKDIILILTIKGDDICKPCKYFKDNKCIDNSENAFYPTKEEWNKVIDSRLFKQLKLKEREEMSALEFSSLAWKTINVADIWQEGSQKRENRKRDLFKGLNQYINL